jgi:hypothetical protein
LQQYQLTSKRLTPFHWRSAVFKSIILQQYSSLSGLLLRLFINAEMTSSTAITSRNLRLFFEKEMVKSNQRVYKWPTSIQWIFALLCEFTRLIELLALHELQPSISLVLVPVASSIVKYILKNEKRIYLFMTRSIFVALLPVIDE